MVKEGTKTFDTSIMLHSSFLSAYLERRTRREISMRKQNIFYRQNSETATITHNSDMEVVDSVIGQSVMRAGLVQKQEDQRVLCLDGGRIKVRIKFSESWMSSEHTIMMTF